MSTIPTVTAPTYVIKSYLGKDHKWRWRMVAANGRVVSDGAEGYSTKNGCMRAITRIVGANLVGNAAT